MVKITVDSSVFIAGILEFELRSDEGKIILQKIFNEEYFVNVPVTVLIEVTGAISRRTKNSNWSNSIKEKLLSLPNFNLIPLDVTRAISASEIAIKTGLRGMDAIIVSIAKEFESELITFDKEMEEKAKVVLS